MPRIRILVQAVSLLIFAAICGAARSSFADVTIGGACSSGGQSAQTDGNNVVCLSSIWQYPYYTFRTAAAAAGASCAGTTAGTMRYNSTLTTMEVCDGTTWAAFVKNQTSVITAPSGGGYFVLSHDTYDANRGGLTGADANCLSDLTTNTGWIGYSTANSNGQLVTGKVHAFLCAATTCNNLIPLATYYFANAGDVTAGGASFTTDSNGNGPGDANNWSAVNYFGTSAFHWTNRNTGSSTIWPQTSFGSSCSSWGTTTGNGATGNTGQTNSTRWSNASSPACSTALKIICYVDP